MGPSDVAAFHWKYLNGKYEAITSPTEENYENKSDFIDYFAKTCEKCRPSAIIAINKIYSETPLDQWNIIAAFSNSALQNMMNSALSADIVES